LGPAQLADVLRHLPRDRHPDLLVGFETSDDAGVFLLPDGRALVQTMDFFTPIVDDPYWYGAIAAANALSDVYAMGGSPITVMNIACFDPAAAPAETWAQILKGAFDKTTEAGAVVVGGHTVEDPQPKFGLSVTGLVDPERVLRNDAARPGDQLWLSKPLGAGIVTTAAKFDNCSPEDLAAATECMARLNRVASEAALAAGARCATDITGFGLAGHLLNIARASSVAFEIDANAMPLLPGVRRMVEDGMTTGGAAKNRAFLGDALVFAEAVPEWLRHVVLDPQTSGGLAVCCVGEVDGSVRIGRVIEGSPAIFVR
jgi:selenide,water dikinase